MSGAPVIRTEALTKHYFLGVRRRRVEAVNDLNLNVGAGEIFAFLGLNGAGKTTTIKLLLDHARPTNGRATLFGMDARKPAARRKVGYLPDLPHFYQFLTARELLNYTGRLFGIGGATREQRREKLLHQVGLDGRGDEPLGGFSRGMLQRVGLAQALMNDPELVILDEPLGGLDPMGRVDLRNIIARLKGEGRTVFFSSHLLDDAQRIADKVGIIHQGRLLACGMLQELLTRKTGWEAEIAPLEGSDIAALCRVHGWTWEKADGTYRVTLPNEVGVRELHRLAGEGQAVVQSLGRRQISLEEAFVEELERWGR